MMRGLHPPHTAELPVTRNMPFPSNSVPSRNQPRNMTGIYLGLEGNIKPPQQRNGMAAASIPPLARARGYSRIKTPTEHRRYRMVEQLRIKEEKKGFVGQRVKTPKRSTQNTTTDYMETEQVPKMVSPKPNRDVQYTVMFTTKKTIISSQKRQKTVISPELTPRETISRPLTSPRALGNVAARNWGPGKHSNREEFYDLIHRNPRNYTVVVNSGVTRSENLTGLMSFAIDPDGTQMAWPDVLADEVHRISTKDEQEATALEECYKKVCKGNVESLQSLLPYRKQNRDGASFSTGFTVRSYRNPNRAQIMADFTDSPPTTRPKTVPPNRPLVPSPYFFKYYSNYSKYPGSASAKSSRKFYPPSSQFEDQFTSLNGTSKVVASPGAGVLSRSLKSRSAGWSESDYKLHTKIHMQNGQTVTLYYNKLETVPGTPGTPTETTNGEQQADLSDIKEIDVTLPYGGVETSRERLSSRVSTPKLPVQPLNSPTPHDDITVSGRQVQIPMTVNPSGDDPDLVTGAVDQLQNCDTSRTDNSDTHQKTSDNNSTQPVSEENQLPETSTKLEPAPGGETEQKEEITTSADSKAMEKSDMEKVGKGKKDFVLGVADEHGTEGEVEIDSPDQEDAEKAPIRGNVRKASISEKVEKSRVSQAYIDGIKVNAEQRKKELAKMLDEHAELVQEISRVSSSDNISAEDRDQ